MAINDPSQIEPLLGRLGQSVNKIADTIANRVQRSMEKIQKTTEVIVKLEESNRKKALNLAGMEGALKSGRLQPLIAEQVKLEEKAKKVEKALSWERLKAEKGTVGAYLSVAREKLGAVGTAAGKVGAIAGQAGSKIQSSFAAVGNAFARLSNLTGTLAAGFNRLQGSMASTVQLAAPASYIRFDYAMKDLSGTIGQILRPAFDDLTRAIRHVADVIISLPAPVKNLIANFAKFGLVVTAIGGAATLLAPLFTAVTVGVTGLVAIGGTLVAVFGEVAAVLALPLAPLAAIAAVLTAGVGIWVAYKTGVLESMAAFKPLAGIAKQLISIAQSMEGAFDGLVPILGQIAAIGIRAFEGMLAILKPLIATSVGLTKAFTPLVSMLLRIGGGLMGQFSSMLERIGKKIAVIGDSLRSKLEPFVQRILPSIMRIGNALSQMFTAIQPAIDGLIDYGAMLFDLFLEYGLPAIEQGIKNMAKAFELMIPVVKVVAGVVKTWVDSMFRMFKWLEETVNRFVASFRDVYETLRNVMAKGGIELPEWKGGGVSSADKPPKMDFTRDMDKSTNSITDALKKMMDLWKKPPRSSLNAAVRPAQFTSIEEFGRQATLSAYGMSRQETPEEKELRKLNDTMREVADNTARNRAEAGNGAIRGF